MNQSPYDTITGRLNFEHIRLESKRFIASSEFGFDMRVPAPDELRAFECEVGRRLVIEFQRNVASRKYDVKTVRFPADWWQAFKRRWFPARILKRWPVKYTEVTMEANAYYPEIQIPERQTFVEVLMSARNRREREWE